MESVIKRAVTVFISRAAIRLLQVVGIITDNYRTQDTCLIGLSKPYDKFGTLKKEILHKIVTKAHPDASVIRFRGPKGDEFRCLLP
jgi:hypothetical protein